MLPDHIRLAIPVHIVQALNLPILDTPSKKPIKAMIGLFLSQIATTSVI